MRLDSVIEKVRAIPMGGTDCALPMVWARRNQLRVSAFVTYTDSETWAGNIHPAQALAQYRAEFVGNAKAVVVGMTSTALHSSFLVIHLNGSIHENTFHSRPSTASVKDHLFRELHGPGL